MSLYPDDCLFYLESFEMLPGDLHLPEFYFLIKGDFKKIIDTEILKVLIRGN